MKDFPLNELLATPDVNKGQGSLVMMLIYLHFNHKLRLSPYSICRALLLIRVIEAISRDFKLQRPATLHPCL
jgi:hypothetical protein